MADVSGLEAKDMFSWALNALGGIAIMATGFLWRSIERSKEEALLKATEVRAESAARIKEVREEIRERQDIDRNAAAAREILHDKRIDELWLAMKDNSAINRDSTARLHARFDVLTERLAQMPTREEMEKGRGEMEKRIMDALHASR